MKTISLNTGKRHVTNLSHNRSCGILRANTCVFFYGNHFPNDCVTKFATCRFPMFFHYDWFCGNLVFALSNNSCDIAGQPVIYMEIISLKTAWQSLSQVASRLYVTDFASIVWGLVHSATFGFMEALFLCSTRVRALPGIWSQFELSMFTNFNFC